MERKMEGKRKGEREKDQVLQLVRCCVWFLLSFFFFFFKYRKTAFGLNLKEAENGIAVALGRKRL